MKTEWDSKEIPEERSYKSVTVALLLFNVKIF